MVPRRDEEEDRPVTKAWLLKAKEPPNVNTMTTVKEKPILFSGPMIRAILDGKKTQTRRVAKLTEGGHVRLGGKRWHPEDLEAVAACPYGKPGERLWVREAFWSKHDTDMGDYGVVTANIDCLDLGKEFHPGWDFVATPECQNPPKERGGRFEPHPTVEPGGWWFGPPDDWDATDADHGARGRWLFLPWEKDFYTKHPSIHMPRWMCRIELEIVSVRIERVKQISHDDAVAEGCYRIEPCEAYPNGNAWGRAAFSGLWDSINKERGLGWDTNPLVWVVEFRRHSI